jgi:hypothetical protein
MLVAVLKSSNFELRNKAGIGNSHKKHTVSLTHVPRTVVDNYLYGPS